jgi:hypothetical protein
MTRILLVSTSYPAGAEDWKGRFIADMVASLARRSDLDISIWAPPGDIPQPVVDATTSSDRDWLNKLMSKGGIAAQLRGGGLSGLTSAVSLLMRLRNAYRRAGHDIAHVNWLQNALPLWGTRTPALVTVLGSDYGLLDKPGMVAALRTVFSRRPTILAPNATWMVPRLESLFGDVARVRTVPFGVGRSWFEIDRSQQEPGCWLAVTRLTQSKIGNLFDWGEGLFNDSRHLHLFGPMQEQVTLPAWVTWHGPTHPTELQTLWFPKATGLISLSQHDEGRPQVMLEAMAAGLPVVASDLPAHRDLIHNGETGWLIHERSQLAKTLTDMGDVAYNHLIGQAAQRFIKREIGDWDDCAARYAALYSELGR